MSAKCPECGWEGASTKVVNGCCPECPNDVRVVYESAPLPDIALKNVEQFNRRALTALQKLSMNEWDTNFVASIKAMVEGYQTLDKKLQNIFYQLVLRHEREIGDKQVLDYAAHHARGAD